MPNEKGPEGMLTLVCLTCGKEQYFADQPPPDNVTCSRCGGTVFRSFFTPTTPDDASLSVLEETSRSMALDEESPDTTQTDVEDLNRP